MDKINTLTQFIERAKDKHNNKYEYSKVIYINTKTKVKIICPEHGVFEQIPNSHLRGANCPKCSLISQGEKRRKTTNNFISKAKLIHGDKYDYSLVKYETNSKKVKIICPEHGVFEQKPSYHLRGTNCPKCSFISQSKKLSKTTDNFISEAKLIHGDKYDYSLVKYRTSKNKVKIICPEHGVFEQKPSNHSTQKQGCPKCANIIVANLSRSNKDEFISKSRLIHGDKYNYDKVEYYNSNKQVIITCLKHGDFKQVPATHLSGCGCPICRESNGESKIRVYLENNNIKYTKQHTFNNCRNKKQLPFDFYLQKYNLCIEYNGIQHYKPIIFFGGEKTFIEQKKNDKIKKDYCKKNNIPLLIIKYDENVNKTLENFFKTFDF
jgi:hypothetical protein